MKRILLLFSFLVSAVWLVAEPLDSVRVSLLTCSPGREIYELFGHTALRCTNVTKQRDLVFNYGVFSFAQPHFVWRFALGETDYMVVAQQMEHFPAEYQARGSSVVAQELNLTREEANRIYNALLENVRPENCEYRYNFLLNNCTSKARDMIEACIDGEIAWPQMEEKLTYRQIIHQYAQPGSWGAEMIDILLGANLDTILVDRATMFAPQYLQRFVAGARIYASDGSLRPLVRNEIEMVKSKEVSLPPLPFYEQVGARFQFLIWGVFAAFLLLVWIEKATGRMLWVADVFLLLVQGLTGCILLFLWFVSEHPVVDNNWLLWLFCPLTLVALPRVVQSAWQDKRTWWHTVHMLYVAIFVLFSFWMPQRFGLIMIPTALTFLTRPISYHLHYNKTNKSNKSKKKKK